MSVGYASGVVLGRGYGIGVGDGYREGFTVEVFVDIVFLRFYRNYIERFYVLLFGGLFFGDVEEVSGNLGVRYRLERECFSFVI